MTALAPPDAPATALRAPVTAAAATCCAVSTVYLTQPVFPEIAASLDTGAQSVRLAFTVTTLAYALAFFLFGPLTDRVRTTVLGGSGAVAVALLLPAAAAAPNLPLFAALLTVAGIAAAAVPAAMIALMPRIAPPGQTGLYFGLIIGATVAGITLGRSFTGLVAGWAGWREAMLLLALLNLAAAFAVTRLPAPPAPPAAAPNSPDLAQAYRAAARMTTHPPVLRPLAIGSLLFFGYLGVITFLTYRLRGEPFGYGAGAIGAVSLAGLIGVAGAPLAGRLSSRIGARRMVLLGLTLVAAGIGALGVATGPVLLTAGVLLVFLGVFSCQPAVLVLLARAAPPERAGAASSLYLLVCLLAGSLSSAALGPVWSAGGWAAVTGTGAAAIAGALALAFLGFPRTEDTPR
ncbi:MFS transporter [Streptomyces xiamenensis]